MNDYDEMLAAHARQVAFRRETERRAREVTPQQAATVTKGWLANRNLNVEAMVSAVLAGADEQMLWNMNQAATKQMLQAGVAPETPTSRRQLGLTTKVEAKAPWWQRGAMAVTRGVFTGLMSVPQYLENLAGQALPLPGQDDWKPSDLVNLVTGIPQAARATELGQVIETAFETGTVDQGSGWFPAGQVSEAQAELQRDLLGTVTGRDGQQVAWTLGRGVASDLANINVINRDSLWFDLVSGTVDAVIEMVTDPTNYIPVAGWGDEAIKGMAAVGGRTGRRVAELREAAVAAEAAGDTVLAERTWRAMARELGASRNLLNNATTPTDVAIRAALLHEAGVVGSGGTRTILLPEFARFLTTGNGRRVVERMVEETNVARIARLHKNKVSGAVARQLAEATTPEEVIEVYARAMANPGADLANSVQQMPHLTPMSLTNMGLWVQDKLASRTRLWNLRPTDAAININDPYGYTKIDQLYRTMPVEPSLAVGRYNTELRDLRIKQFIEAQTTGDESQIKNVINAIADDFRRTFVKLGFSEDQATQATRWATEEQIAGSYRTADLLGGGPVDNSILLTTQVLQNDVHVIDPQMFGQMYREMTRLRQVLRSNPAFSTWQRTQRALYDAVIQREAAEAAQDWDAVRNLDKQVRTLEAKQTRLIEKQRAGGDALAVSLVRGVQMIADNAMGFLKNIMILRGAYLPRVIGEEIARTAGGNVYGNDPLEMIATMIRWAYNNDATGQRFVRAVSDYDSLALLRDDRAAELAILRRSGAPQDQLDEAQRALDEIDNMLANLDDTVQSSMAEFNEAMIGRDRFDALRTVTKANAESQIRTGSRQVADVRIPAQQRNWVRGVADRVSFLSGDPVMRRLARGRFGDKTLVTVDGITDSIPNHLAAGRIVDHADAVTHWLRNGGGRPYLDRIARARAADNIPFDPDSHVAVRGWVQDMLDELQTVTGGDETLISAVGTGRFDGRQLMARDAKTGRWVPNDGLVNHIDGLKTNPNMPQLMWYKTQETASLPRPKIMETVASVFFGSLYGKGSDFLARSPTFRRVYWKHMETLISSATPEEAARIVKNAQTAGLPGDVLRNLEAKARGAAGQASLEDLDKLAKAGALSYTRDLLFDASKRGTGMDMLRLIVPFGDAWKEVLLTWGRLLVQQRGLPAKKLLKGIRAATEAPLGPDVHGVDEEGNIIPGKDGRREGFFHRNSVGEWVYTVPFSAEMSRLLSGGKVTTALDAPVAGLNIAGSIFPGLGPVSSELVAGALPDDPRWDSVKAILFPFGTPADADTPGGRTNVWQRYFVPPSVRKMAAVLDPEGWQGYLRNLLNDFDTDPTYQATVNYTYKQLLAAYMAQGVDADAFQNQDQIRREAAAIADTMYFLRGVGQFIGPATPMSRYMVDTAEGNVVIGLLIDEWRTLEKEYEAAGGDPDDAIFDMLDRYGPQVWMTAAPNTVTLLQGVDASKEWWDWYRVNKNAINAYRDVAAYLGPSGEFDLESYTAQSSAGLRRVATPQEMYEQAAEVLAWAYLDRLKESLPPEAEWDREIRAMFSDERAAIEQRFSITLGGTETANRRRDQINQLQTMVEAAEAGDRNAQALLAGGTGDAVRVWMAAREAANEVVRDELGLTGVNAWATAVRAAPIRDQMRELGEQLASENEGFARLYRQVLEREMLSEETDADYQPSARSSSTRPAGTVTITPPRRQQRRRGR